jgi:hypothetical protein
VEYLLKFSFMRLEDLCRNMRWNKPFDFHNFVDIVYVPCNKHLVHMSLKCMYKHNMKRSLVKFISNCQPPIIKHQGKIVLIKGDYL